MKLNENNIQSPFQYNISGNTFELLERIGELELNTDNVQVKVFENQRLFCADIGYAVDGALEYMEFLIDDIKVYPNLLEELKDLQTKEIKDNEIYLIKNDINFKSIIFFPLRDLNKNFKYKITTCSSVFSAFMFDSIAEKLNSLDTNYPIKNYYEDAYYKINDIIKYKGCLYRVFKDFTGDKTDYYLKANCSLITPFRKLELNAQYKAFDLIEYNNNFFMAQRDFTYENIINLSGLLKPLDNIIFWFDSIDKIYKNQIIIKDDILYIVLEDIENPVWNNIQSKIDNLIKADNTFYDDNNSGFGCNTNTVQKAVEKLKNDKQNNLISGNNINLSGNTISVNGGTNKEYIQNAYYYTDDLIIYNNKLYKVNEDFTSSDWNTDRNKCTLLSTGDGDSSKAFNIIFDSSKSNLEYITGYDFPRFKSCIHSYSLVLSDGTCDYNASIFKQEDGSYLLSGVLENFNIIKSSEADIIIKSINNLNSSNFFGMISLLSQFFNFTDEYSSYENEINIHKNNNFEFCFIFINGFIHLKIRSYNELNIQVSDIKLNIRNRVLHTSDIYINYITENDPFLKSIKLVQYNNTAKYTGVYSAYDGLINQLIFYSDLDMNNYFDLIDNEKTDLKNTLEITSSCKKAVKFAVKLFTDNIYILYLAYQDGSIIQAGDVFTFNLTPDKNAYLEPIKKPADNVQDAIDSIILNKIMPIGSQYIQFAEDDGSFENSKSPENLYGGTWKLKYNNESVYFRTEGSLSEEERENGIQDYAMKRVQGNVWGLAGQGNDSFIPTDGVFAYPYKDVNDIFAAPSSTIRMSDRDGFNFDNKRSGKTSDKETRVKNRLIRVWERIA
ncbi:phage tail protein [uncultured Brachyspira sp.]|uniref:phage tail protein n=1 Tax=uncultured Brachyspira sp. TaxID=221953 RepID=UPI0025FD5DF3|nr:phage tail protein [uncultured Brachyspira sp.]